MEILDLIAKISWETNEKALQGVSKEIKNQDKSIEELRHKGRLLNDQMIKTNDPAKVKRLNDELQKTRKAVDSIISAQKQQVELVGKLNERQRNLIAELKKTNDPKLVQGLLRNLSQVDNQLSALSTKAATLPSKIGGISQSLLQGFGLGAGAFTLQAALGMITNFVSGAIGQFESAAATANNLRRSLSVVGKGDLFDGLIAEAETLAEKFNGLFDNDDIVDAQVKLVNYGKVTREELSQLLPVILNLAAAEKIDLVSATESVIGILEGRGGQTLRQYGLSVKDLKTEHDRLNIVLGEFSTKLEGAADTYGNTAQGIRQKNKILLEGIQEDFGEIFAGISSNVSRGINVVLTEMSGLIESFKDDKLTAFLSLFNPALAARLSAERNIKSVVKQQAGIGGANADLTGDSKGVINPNADFTDEDAKKVIAPVVKKLQQEAKKIKIAFNVGSPLDGAAPFAQGFGTMDGRNRAEIDEALMAWEKDLGIFTQAYEGDLNEQKKLAREAEAEITKAKKEESDKRKQIAKDELIDQAFNLAGRLSDLYGQEIDDIDRVIDAQQRRVDAAKESSEMSLKIEQQRLDELTKKRAKYERAQRQIEAGVIVAQNLLAVSYAITGISKASAEGGAAAPLTIAANVLALGAGILGVYSALRSVDQTQGFEEGGYTGDGAKSEKSLALGRKRYTYHKGEYVMNADLTEKHKDMFEGLHRGRLIAKKLGGSYVLMPKGIDVDSAVSDHHSVKAEFQTQNLEQLLQSIDRRLSDRDVIVNNHLDADGFSMSVASKLGRLSIIDKMRNS